MRGFQFCAIQSSTCRGDGQSLVNFPTSPLEVYAKALLQVNVRGILISWSWSNFLTNCVSVGWEEGFSNDSTSCLKATASASNFDWGFESLSTIIAGGELR
jgi:hypothetical protein